MAEVVLQLFVAGSKEEHESTVRHIEKLCANQLNEEFRLEVIDVRSCPQRAEAARVFATPTLCRVSPKPGQRIFGDLTSCNELLLNLGLPDLDNTKRSGSRTPTKPQKIDFDR